MASRSVHHPHVAGTCAEEPIDSTQRLTVGIKFFHREQGSFEFFGPLSWASGLRVLPRSGTLNKEDIRSAGEHNIGKCLPGSVGINTVLAFDKTYNISGRSTSHLLDTEYQPVVGTDEEQGMRKAVLAAAHAAAQLLSATDPGKTNPNPGCSKKRPPPSNEPDTREASTSEGPKHLYSDSSSSDDEELEANAGALFNKHETNEADLNDLDQCLDHSYNLFCLFLRDSGNLTVWTVSKAIPYFVRKLHDDATMQKWKGWTWCLNGTIRVAKIVTGGQGCAGDILLHVKHKHDGAAPVPTTSSLQFSLGYQRGLERRN
ncbi:hypothetical protein Bbelb_282480 [Branchiostoma belcheri]|nr:hypothetical protein Bbelb_282480 [Branchiostoma belcheri]